MPNLSWAVRFIVVYLFAVLLFYRFLRGRWKANLFPEFMIGGKKQLKNEGEKKRRRKAYLHPMELARDIITWRELRDKL